VIFLIGDFTSLIGDPSGRNSTRPPLTPEQIKVNAETYYRQASLVLDPARTEVRYNSEWSEPLGASGMIPWPPNTRGAHDGARRFPQALHQGQSISVHEFHVPADAGLRLGGA
jgi:tyrosyl-tRNA synthetase